MSENLNIKEFMKDDAFAFDNISLAICKEEKPDYKLILKQCEDFENSVILFKIVPSYFVMKTILCFKLEDYETAHRYINGSLKYLIYIAKNTSELSPMEKTNFDEYKTNVLDQYKILTSKKPEYLNIKELKVPELTKFITTADENILNKEINRRVLQRQK
ncbi:hypothetical protein [Arcobacter roscoffensis]|uniref:Uncharacterized protein n=1 Tax=Arcobacter roscoffensis TaxID=2961520 RepID=A0ABY5E0K6_9BACT|nr:hypothetical protein [Arcobacter roscoffensis]UTJ05744.1 hypothetical protein NJU99_10780 [Arcobacter roscoffensis]